MLGKLVQNDDTRCVLAIISVACVLFTCTRRRKITHINRNTFYSQIRLLSAGMRNHYAVIKANLYTCSFLHFRLHFSAGCVAFIAAAYWFVACQRSQYASHFEICLDHKQGVQCINTQLRLITRQMSFT